MKQIPLTAAMAFAALAGGTGTLSAQAFSLEEAYVKGFGGATWPSDLDSTLTEDGMQIALPSFDHDTGYTLGVAVGASVTPNFSMEIEYAYRKADFTVTDRAEGDRADGDTSANAFMFNALCLIPRFDGAILSQEWKEALWARFVTEAPRPRTPSELQYNDRKLRSRR